MKNRKYLLEFLVAKQLAEEAGKTIQEIYYRHIEKSVKTDGTPVTNGDIRSNEIIMGGLRECFPKDGIVSEEAEGISAENGRTWYIDPIDGTKGFVNRSDQFAVHIGLAEEGKAVLGIVYKPTTGEYYYGIKGEGAYLHFPNGLEKKLQVSQEGDKVLMVTKGFILCEFGKEFIRKIQPQRILVNGGEGLRFIRIAEGIATLHLPFDSGCHTWDVCAPQIIAEEAGARVQYADGQPILYHEQSVLGKYFVVANNQEFAETACKLISEISKP